jgi:hypothetical protein
MVDKNDADNILIQLTTYFTVQIDTDIDNPIPV